MVAEEQERKVSHSVLPLVEDLLSCRSRECTEKFRRVCSHIVVVVVVVGPATAVESDVLKLIRVKCWH